MFRCCAEEADQPFTDAPTRYLEAMQLRYRCVKLGNGTCRVFVFTKSYELQTRCIGERLHIGNTDEYDLMSPRLKPSGEGSHRIQVTNNGQTYKTDFHVNS